MIAQVKIALFEQWCPAAKLFCEEHPEWKKIAGLPVAIIVESMQVERTPICKGRCWLVPNEVAQPMFELYGRDFDPLALTRICEHMLEMD
jgi:hypothetical protein